MKKCSDCHRKYLIKMALSEWKRVHAETRSNELLLGKASHFRDKQALIGSIRSWTECHRRRRSLQQKELMMIRGRNEKQMMFVMLIWTESANQLQLRRKRTWMSFEFRANRLKRHFFVIWFQRFAIHSSLRHRQMEFVRMSHNKTMQDVFYKWCNTYNGLIYKADLLESHYNEICCYRLSKYFTLWVSVYHCVGDTRDRYMMSKIFADWKQTTKRRNQFKKQIIQKPYKVYST